MIELRRDDNMSIFLVCDEFGLTELSNAMHASEGATPNSVNATVDMSILTLKRKSPSVEATLVIQRGDSTRLSQGEEGIVWTMTDEDRECVISRLKQCESERTFTPAELIRVQVLKNKHLDYVYGEFH